MLEAFECLYAKLIERLDVLDLNYGTEFAPYSVNVFYLTNWNIYIVVDGYVAKRRGRDEYLLFNHTASELLCRLMELDRKIEAKLDKFIEEEEVKIL